MFEKLTGKIDKQAEVKRSVMSDMRRLCIAFRKKCGDSGVQAVSSSDMLVARTILILRKQ